VVDQASTTVAATSAVVVRELGNALDRAVLEK
jgi:hypothetical protein